MQEQTFRIVIGDDYGAAEDQQLEVVLSSAPLVKLYERLKNGADIYTALNLKRPGDMYQYLTLQIVRAPDSFKPSGDFYDGAAKTSVKRAFRAGDKTNYLFFSRQFEQGEYAPDIDQAWQMKTQGNDFGGFVRSVFDRFTDALTALSLYDDLIFANSEMVKKGTHPLDMFPFETAFSIARIPTKKPLHSDDFYSELAKNLSDPTVHSCAYFGEGDLKVLQMMTTEQLRRSRLSGLEPEVAFPLAAHINDPIDCRAWGCKITFYQEGISKMADLFINDHPRSTTAMQFLESRKMSTHIVLSSVPQDLYVKDKVVQKFVGVFVYPVAKT